MAAEILDGRAAAAELRAEAAAGVAEMQQRHGVTPGLAALLIGDDPASAVYVRNKRRAGEAAGLFSETIHLPAATPEREALARIAALNDDRRFHGILVQLPLPPSINAHRVIEAVSPAKDVDGLHPYNFGRLLQGRPIFTPGTPAGIQRLLLRYGHDPAGANVVICGRSDIVGKPLAALLSQRGRGANATVTLCHTATRNLPEITRQADILVGAMGQPGAVNAAMVKPGAVVVDVGINRVDDPSRPRGYRLQGDVLFEEVAARAAAITPVPGGVGPMTIAMLLLNTLTAARISIHGQP